jgi:type VI protein secretion system component VasK
MAHQRRYRNGYGHPNGNGHWLTRSMQASVVAIAIWLAGYTVTGIWWASAMTSAVAAAKDEIKSLQAENRVLRDKSDRIIAVEVKLENISETLKQIQASLSRQNGRVR